MNNKFRSLIIGFIIFEIIAVIFTPQLHKNASIIGFAYQQKIANQAINDLLIAQGVYETKY